MKGFLIGLVLALGWIGSTPSGAAGPIQPSEQSGHFTFRVRTPAIQLAGPEGSSKVQLEGFGALAERPGVPQIPTRTVLVAIPPGAVPRLEFRTFGEEELLLGIVPAAGVRRVSAPSKAQRDALRLADGNPGKRTEILRRTIRELATHDPAIYGGEALFPARVAWLGNIGVLRDQRYVEVHLAPVRFDPRLPGLRVVEEIEVAIHFGDLPEKTLPAVEPLFESVYRDSFANYSQGRGFRLSGGRSRFPRPAVASVERGGGAPILRIKVRTDAIRRLDFDALSASGLTASSLANWRLTNRGLEVPLQIEDDGDGFLESGEWVQFYGQALTGEPPSILHTEIPNANDIFAANDFSDENIYFLTAIGAPVPTIDERDSTPTHVRIPPTDFDGVSHMETDDGFRPLAGADPWYWLPTLFSSGTTVRSETVPLPGLLDGTRSARLLVHVRGTSESFEVDPDHLTEVRLKNDGGALLATAPGSFDGRSLHLHDVTWNYTGGPELTDPAEVEFEVFPGAVSNNVILDYIEIQYRRRFRTVADELVFTWPDEDAEFVISGVDDPLAEIYEITRASGQDVAIPTRLTGVEVSGAGPFNLRFRMDQEPALADGTTRTFLVAGAAAIVAPDPADITLDTVSDLKLNSHQADMIVIAHPSPLDDGPGSRISQLLAYRATPAGGGLSSKIVLIQDVEDEFNHGLPGPQAIREFLRWVMSDAPGEGWAQPKPTMVMLVGDGSFNYKGGVPVGNYIPTQIMYRDRPELGYYASDNDLAAVIGDDPLADLVVGRISVRTRGEANTVLQKILDYETVAPAGPWENHTLFVSDRGKLDQNPGEALDFELINANAAGSIPAPYTSRQLRYYTDYFDNPGELTPAASMKAAIKSAVNGLDGPSDGAAMLQYVGHGNFVVWSDDAFFDERLVPNDLDSGDLNNGMKLPFVVVNNCLSGGFHAPQLFTMAEDWMKRVGGGSVGFFSPSGLSNNFVSDAVSELLFDRIYGLRKERVVGALSIATQAFLCTTSKVEPCQHYVLLGDPAMRLRLRSVGPPLSPQAAAENVQVTLSWAASSSSGVTYDVYRKFDTVQSLYAKINGQPVGGTEYIDTNVINTLGYVYYIVAVDPQGFESAASNFNSDCDVEGPDCLHAVPLNPDPPTVPTGVTLSDPGVGSQLTVAWNLNPEPDIDFYTVLVGTEAGNYTSQTDVSSLGSSAVVDGLIEGQRYFVAISATNTSSKTSAPSAESSDLPWDAPGFRPPGFISDLTVSVAGTDLRLDWSEVTSDIHGKPIQVVLYEILRGTADDFSNAGLTKIAECIAPCTSFDDLNAHGAPASYHYRVRAIDGAGEAGGLGSDYPAGTTLWVTRSELTPGNVVLTWTAVETTESGVPIDLSHYAVFSSEEPFTLLDVRNGLLDPPLIETGTTLELTPAAQNRFYSVLAVDDRGNTSTY